VKQFVNTAKHQGSQMTSNSTNLEAQADHPPRAMRGMNVHQGSSEQAPKSILRRITCQKRMSARFISAHGAEKAPRFVIDRALRAIFGGTEAMPGSHVSARDP